MTTIYARNIRQRAALLRDYPDATVGKTDKDTFGELLFDRNREYRTVMGTEHPVVSQLWQDGEKYTVTHTCNGIAEFMEEYYSLDAALEDV